MSFNTVANLKDSVAGMLSGLDLSNVDSLNAAFERAARIMLQKADVPEAQLTQNMVLYDGVYDYTCDERIFATAVVDLRPQGVSRTPNNYVYKKPTEQFDRIKGGLPNGTMVTFDYSEGTPIIRIESTLTIPKIVLDTMTQTTGWTNGGSAGTLTQDTAVYYQSPASIRFTLTGSSAGTLTKTMDNPTDLSSYEGVGVAFLAIRIPDGATASNLTSIQLKLGSDSSNYDSVTSTEGFLGAWTAGNWLLVAFDQSTATSTGTPDWSAMEYIQITLNHTATLTNFRVGGLWISQPSPAQLLCQTNAIFKATGGTPLATITSTSDEILLNPAAYTIYEYESSLSVLQQTGGNSAEASMQTLQGTLNGIGTDPGLYALYRGDNPSQEIRTVGNWYGGSSYGTNNSR